LCVSFHAWEKWQRFPYTNLIYFFVKKFWVLILKWKMYYCTFITWHWARIYVVATVLCVSFHACENWQRFPYTNLIYFFCKEVLSVYFEVRNVLLHIYYTTLSQKFSRTVYSDQFFIQQVIKTSFKNEK